MKRDPQKFAKAIGIPTDEWPSNCYAISKAILEAGLVKGKLRYGMYYGPIAEGTIFHGRPFARHGWIERPKGGIIDPTRWVFEGVDPYIFKCGRKDDRVDDYDVGASYMRAVNRTEPPENSGEDYVGERIVFSEDAQPMVEGIFGTLDLCRQQLFWLANTPPRELEPVAAPVYQAFIDAGHDAWIPFDFRKLVFD